MSNSYKFYSDTKDIMKKYVSFAVFYTNKLLAMQVCSQTRWLTVKISNVIRSISSSTVLKTKEVIK